MNIELFYNYFHSISGHIQARGSGMAEALGRHGHPATQAHGIEKQEACHHRSQRGGATREEQMALAKHMAHNIMTAYRYYDKNDQWKARHQCLDVIQNSIRVS